MRLGGHCSVAYTSASLMHTICMVKMFTMEVMCVLDENFDVVTNLTLHYQRHELSGYARIYLASDANVQVKSAGQ